MLSPAHWQCGPSPSSPLLSLSPSAVHSFVTKRDRKSEGEEEEQRTDRNSWSSWVKPAQRTWWKTASSTRRVLWYCNWLLNTSLNFSSFINESDTVTCGHTWDNNTPETLRVSHEHRVNTEVNLHDWLLTLSLNTWDDRNRTGRHHWSRLLTRHSDARLPPSESGTTTISAPAQNLIMSSTDDRVNNSFPLTVSTHECPIKQPVTEYWSVCSAECPLIIYSPLSLSFSNTLSADLRSEVREKLQWEGHIRTNLCLNESNDMDVSSCGVDEDGFTVKHRNSDSTSDGSWVNTHHSVTRWAWLAVTTDFMIQMFRDNLKSFS